MSDRYFAVIDTETNWYNYVMSIGVVIADSAGFFVVDKRYYILYPECNAGGMYSAVLHNADKSATRELSRPQAIADIKELFSKYGVTDILAYNAPFDYKCLSELHGYVWRDILPVAANRNLNLKLPDNCEYFSTGLLKHGRGLQNVMRLAYNRDYREVHNGLTDAEDELLLMQLIDQPLSLYRQYKPKVNSYTDKTLSEIRNEDKLIRACKYVVDELCGGSIRAVDCVAFPDSSTSNYLLTLQCARCLRTWRQNADEFLSSPKCPYCGK